MSDSNRWKSWGITPGRAGATPHSIMMVCFLSFIILLPVLFSSCDSIGNIWIEANSRKQSKVRLTPGSSNGIAWQVIPFGDLSPEGVPQVFSWNALGIDPDDRVYVVFGDDGRRDPIPPDCFLYRYDSRSGERSYLGSFRWASQAAGNWQPGEGIMKGHTAVVYRDGHMWMGSMPFHDATGPVEDGYRGSHLYAWDITGERLVDMSVSQPSGVLQDRSGIMVLDLHRQSNLILGLSVPRGDLLFYDADRGALDRVVPGPREELWKQLPRNLVCAPDGRIFFAFGHMESAVYIYDPGSGSIRRSEATTGGGFWNGSALMKDGRGAYISTVRGELFQIDFKDEHIRPLGHFLPQDELARGERITQLFCLALSADGRKLYAVPTAITTRLQALYEYDVATGKVEKLVDTKAMGLFGMTFTGSAVQDSQGRIYFAVHYYGREAFILQLDLSGRTQPASMVQDQGERK